MYNQDVIDRLNDLKYLFSLKKANVSAISKKNNYGDMVKFFAQINNDDIIQKISYKASGCTTFLALCSYFCEIVEGKSIEEALNINEEDLSKFTKLDDSKVHVYSIILDTFQLLIKKYQKGIKKGTIKPCENLKSESQNLHKQKKVTKNSKTIKVDDELNEILLDKKTKKNIEKKNNTKFVDETDLIQNTIKSILDENNENKNLKSSETNKISHLDLLNKKIQIKEYNEKKQINSNNLNNILKKINSKTDSNNKTNHSSLDNAISLMKNNLKNLDKQKINLNNEFDNVNDKSDKNNKIIEKNQNKNELDTQNKQEKEKKSLFSWFRKK